MRPKRPHDLPEFRIWLHKQWQPGNLFWEVAEITKYSHRIPGQEWVSFEAIFDDRASEQAELYWVTAEMAALINTASKTLPPTTLTKELMPAPSGLVWFEEPLIGMAAQNEYPDGAAMPPEITIRTMLWGESMIPPGPHAAVGIATYAELQMLAPAGRTDWEYGIDTDEPIDQAIADDDLRVASMAEDRRWMATFWLLLSQTGIAQTSSVRAQPREIRRGKRALPSLTSEAFDVRIVDVHKPKSSGVQNVDSPGRKVDWSHRWIVSPHWRQQAYGPGYSLHRPVLIQAFVKGPTEKPLKIKDTVHVLKDGQL